MKLDIATGVSFGCCAYVYVHDSFYLTVLFFLCGCFSWFADRQWEH